MHDLVLAPLAKSGLGDIFGGLGFLVDVGKVLPEPWSTIVLVVCLGVLAFAVWYAVSLWQSGEEL